MVSRSPYCPLTAETKLFVSVLMSVSVHMLATHNNLGWLKGNQPHVAYIGSSIKYVVLNLRFLIPPHHKLSQIPDPSSPLNVTYVMDTLPGGPENMRLLYIFVTGKCVNKFNIFVINKQRKTKNVVIQSYLNESVTCYICLLYTSDAADE